MLTFGDFKQKAYVKGIKIEQIILVHIFIYVCAYLFSVNFRMFKPVSTVPLVSNLLCEKHINDKRQTVK